MLLDDYHKQKNKHRKFYIIYYCLLPSRNTACEDERGRAQHIFMPPSISGHVCKPRDIVGRGRKHAPRRSTRNACKCESGHTYSGGPDGECCNGSLPNWRGPRRKGAHVREGSGSGGKGWVHEGNGCHRQIFGRETLSDLTAKSNAIEMKRGLQALYDAYSQDNVAL
jgi:hypothetical protein